MRKCVLYIAASCDGYIARENGDVDWLRGEGDYGYEAFLTGIDTIIMGNKTYQQVRGFGTWPYDGLRTIVYSRSLAGTKDDRVEFTNAMPPELLAELRGEEGRDIWLVGGGELVRLFMNASLIDEYHVFIQSIVLGGGVRLFPDQTSERRLRLLRVQHYDEHFVRLVYTPSDTTS